MFERAFHRATVTRPGLCPCGARAGYTLSNGRRTIYRCPACANGYTAPEWQAEALPHIQREFDAMVYDGYKLHRATYTPQQLASLFLTFKPQIEELEARYQAELAGKRVVS